MAARSYREKRQCRKRSGRTSTTHTAEQRSIEPVQLVSLGTVASLVPELDRGPELSVLVAGRYEVHVGNGFQAAALARLVHTLEQLA